MHGLDAWLEAPYVNAARQEEAFEKWCEATDTDPEASDAWDLFEAQMADDEHTAEIDVCHHNRDEVGHAPNPAAGCGQPPQPCGICSSIIPPVEGKP